MYIDACRITILHCRKLYCNILLGLANRSSQSGCSLSIFVKFKSCGLWKSVTVNEYFSAISIRSIKETIILSSYSDTESSDSWEFVFFSTKYCWSQAVGQTDRQSCWPSWSWKFPRYTYFRCYFIRLFTHFRACKSTNECKLKLLKVKFDSLAWIRVLIPHAVMIISKIYTSKQLLPHTIDWEAI